MTGKQIPITHSHGLTTLMVSSSDKLKDDKDIYH